MTKFIVDAGPLIGYLAADDQWHAWSVETLNAIDDVLHSSEAVTAEVCFRLRRQKPAISRLLAWVDAGGLQIVPVVAEHAAELDVLVQKYDEMDLCDATVVHLSEVYRDCRVITTDSRHFHLYRRLRHQSIPLICPA